MKLLMENWRKYLAEAYYSKGKCVYKKDDNKKVGCTDGSVKDYLAALHKNVPDATNESFTGEIIECERGQYDHPGSITRISSKTITMQPDPETGNPILHVLLVIGDQSGEKQIGIPGGPNLFFPEDTSVTEYPLKKYKV